MRFRLMLGSAERLDLGVRYNPEKGDLVVGRITEVSSATARDSARPDAALLYRSKRADGKSMPTRDKKPCCS